MLETEPFILLRIHFTNGKVFDIHHPGAVLVLRRRVDIGIPTDESGRIMDRVEHCSLLHVVRVEELPNGKPRRPEEGSVAIYPPRSIGGARVSLELWLQKEWSMDEDGRRGHG